jgi:hypothetical protein
MSKSLKTFPPAFGVGRPLQFIRSPASDTDLSISNNKSIISLSDAAAVRAIYGFLDAPPERLI